MTRCVSVVYDFFIFTLMLLYFFAILLYSVVLLFSFNVIFMAHFRRINSVSCHGVVIIGQSVGGKHRNPRHFSQQGTREHPYHRS